MTIEACVAFGCASLAISEVTEHYDRAGGNGRPQVLELLAELRAAHSQLRILFASDADDEVCGLALSILVLADHLTSSFE